MNAIIKDSWITATDGFTSKQRNEFIIKMVKWQLSGKCQLSNDVAVNVALQFAMAEIDAPKVKLEVNDRVIDLSKESLEVEFEDDENCGKSDVDNSSINNNIDIYNNTDSININKKEKCVINNTSQKKEESCAKEESITPKEVAEMYNDICVSFPRVLRPYALGSKRKEQIKLRSREHSASDWRQVWRNMESSEFCRTHGFATFDWVIKSETNFQKVLEGNFNRRNIEESTLEKNQRVLKELGINEDTILDWGR